MPESKGRKRDDYVPPPDKSSRKPVKLGSARWVAPTMVTLFVIGLCLAAQLAAIRHHERELGLGQRAAAHRPFGRLTSCSMHRWRLMRQRASAPTPRR